MSWLPRQRLRFSARVIRPRTIIYIGQVDETGHKDGFHPTVPSYIKAIENADACVGIVLDAVKAHKTFAQEDWLVLVTADHGGKGTNHGGGHNVPEIRNSFVIVSGTRPNAVRWTNRPTWLTCPLRRWPTWASLPIPSGILTGTQSD